MALRAGELNQRIAVFQRDDAKRDNPYNAAVFGPPRKIVDAWASVSDLGSAEVVKARQVAVECSMVLELRWRKELERAVNLLVLWRSRVLEVIGVPIDADGIRERMQLLCREVSPPPGMDVSGAQAASSGGAQ